MLQVCSRVFAFALLSLFPLGSSLPALSAQGVWGNSDPLWSGGRALRAMPAPELSPLLRPWTVQVLGGLEASGVTRPEWPMAWPSPQRLFASSAATAERTRALERWLFERSIRDMAAETQAEARAWFERYSKEVISLDPRGWSSTRKKARTALEKLRAQGSRYPMALPPAWSAHIDGTLALYRGQEEVAIRAFKRVLALPAKARREVGAAAAWALLRLGADARDLARAEEVRDPRHAARLAWELARDRVRRVIGQEGAYDPFGLHADTWLIEARRQADAKRWPAAAAALMGFAALDTSPDAAELSAFMRARVSEADDRESVLKAWAQDPQARALLDAGFASRFPTRSTARIGAPPELRRIWLHLTSGFDLAFPEARLARASLLLRLGEAEEAGELLTAADRELPFGRLIALRVAASSASSSQSLVPYWQSALPIFDAAEGEGVRGDHLALGWAGRLRTELAMMRLEQGAVVVALKLLEEADAWRCSRARGVRNRILERIATPAELEAWLANTPPSVGRPASAEPRPASRMSAARAALAQHSAADFRGDARHTWARTRMRATAGGGVELLAALRSSELRADLPPAVLALADELIADLERAEERFRTRADRAAALMRVAETLRAKGRHLYATSTSPDHWTRGECWPSSRRYPDARLRREPDPLLGPGPLERTRVEASESTHPKDSAHVLRRAVLIATEAADLLPDNSPELAHWLLRSGHWIKTIDPKAADPLYKKLVRRCRGLEIGREADRKRWFPPLVPLAEIR